MEKIRQECKELFKNIRTEIKDIKDNHLNHIHEELTEIKTLVRTKFSLYDKFMFGVMMLLGAIFIVLITSIV